MMQIGCDGNYPEQVAYCRTCGLKYNSYECHNVRRLYNLWLIFMVGL